MQPLPKLPGYELLTRLGGGILTSVYAARELESDEPCAVKLVREDCEDRDVAEELLRREARAALAVGHPHLVAVRAAHVTRPPHFLVMELLGGETLRRRLRRDYRLDVPTALWVTRQTAEALSELHRAGYVHGDVKPDNVRLTGAATAVLIDLGFAHRPGENADMLARGYVLGTVNYLAPELCAAEPRDGPEADVFSLGVTLFEMLTGQLPYPTGSVAQTFRRHEADPPADVRRHAPNLPPALASLLGRMLARRPSDRPRASAVVAQLVALEIAAIGRRAA
jgi:eukaryotic-like serine/threonine-protein kinase